MKRQFWFVSAILAVTVLFVACGKRNNDDSTIANVAATNNLLRSSCLNQPYVVNNQVVPNGANCGFATMQNNPYFTQYPVANGYYQGYASNFSGGFNSCPAGSVPTYNPMIGLTCVQTTYFTTMGWDVGSQYQFPVWQWNSTSFNFNFYGHSHYGSYMKGGYHNRVLGSCMKGTASCAAGHCMAAPGSRIGICGGMGGRRGGGYGYNKPGRRHGRGPIARPHRGGSHRGGSHGGGHRY